MTDYLASPNNECRLIREKITIDSNQKTGNVEFQASTRKAKDGASHNEASSDVAGQQQGKRAHMSLDAC